MMMLYYTITIRLQGMQRIVIVMVLGDPPALHPYLQFVYRLLVFHPQELGNYVGKTSASSLAQCCADCAATDKCYQFHFL